MRRACKSGRRVGIAAENGVYSIFNCIQLRSKTWFLAYTLSPLAASCFLHDGNKKSPRP
nr:MAG TPA: hypothetical protein [Caudoviricetes sp.]